MSGRMRLLWYTRNVSRAHYGMDDDGLFNADCACGVTLAGNEPATFADAERWHTEQVRREPRDRPCGPVLPAGIPGIAPAPDAIAAAEERGRRAGIGETAAQAAQIAERWNAGHAASLIRNLARTPRGHSAECGGQPAGSGCICGVGFDAAPETVTLYAVPDGIEAHIRDLHAIENALHEFEADPIAALRVVGEHVSMALHNLRALAPRDSGKVCNNCKRAQKASDGRTEAGVEIGPRYCATLREDRK